MTDMLTAVARAMREVEEQWDAKRYALRAQDRLKYFGEDGYQERLDLEKARAAIRALMEPTKEMLMDGNEIISNQCDVWISSDGVDYSAPPCANDVFQAMLRRALGGEL